MASERTVDTPETEPGQAPEAAAEDSAADMATLTVNQPLKIINEAVGSDPYNHTGRFSVPDKE